MYLTPANHPKPTLNLHCLWEGFGAQILTTRWAADEHKVTRTGHTEYFVIEVMLAGTFEKRSSYGQGMADANVAMLFGPGERFEIDHSCGNSNAGVTIRIEPAALARWLPSTSCRSYGTRSRSATRLVSPSAALNVQCLAGYLSSPCLNPPDPKLVASRLRHCLCQLLAVSPDTSTQIERIQRARQYLNLNFASPVRRSELARAVGCSPWLLSREFMRQVGLTMQAYLNRLRLRAGLRAIVGGCDDLTALGLRVGFSSHSHFSAAFKAEFGLSPRDVRGSIRRSVSHW